MNSHASTVKAVAQKVLGMIRAGQLPAPEANFKLTGVAYDPRFFNGPKGDVMAVEQVPEDGTPNSGKIIVFAPIFSLGRRNHGKSCAVPGA